MRFSKLRVAGIRCFEDTGWIELSPNINVFVGLNNAGKSTILRGALMWQGFPFSPADLRPGAVLSIVEAQIDDLSPEDPVRGRTVQSSSQRLIREFRGSANATGQAVIRVPDDGAAFSNRRPNHLLVPFVAKRKAVSYGHNVSLQTQSIVDGTFGNLYSRVDLLATAGHPFHADFMASVRDAIGLEITTSASDEGKVAGFYLDPGNFVTLDRMGDGVSEMVALIVELCLERGKVFVLEEPETNLHPAGVRSLMALVRRAAGRNQFLIATHSNIVVRELGAEPNNKIFRVFRTDADSTSPSRVEELPSTPESHMQILRELGYAFGDLALHDAWLFLEESSSERIIQQLLVPWFAPSLAGKLRTYSAAGVSNIEPAVSEFLRLIVFVHLQPAYEGRLWVRADGDEAGLQTIQSLRAKFSNLPEDRAGNFSQANFENYYPSRFHQQVGNVLSIGDRQAKRQAKAALLEQVVEWSLSDTQAQVEWSKSAHEVVNFLLEIERNLNDQLDQ